MTVLQVFETTILLLVLPMAMGLLLRKEKESLLISFVYGYILQWAIFFVVCVPEIIKKGTLSRVSKITIAVYAVCAVLGLVKYFLTKKERNRPAVLSKSEIIYLAVFLGLVLFQIYKALFFAYEDGDDSFYVSISQYSAVADRMYTADAYRGTPTVIWYRYALAPFPEWIASFAQRTGINAAIFSHTIIPPVFIVITYIIFNEIAKLLFKEDAEKRYMFLALIAVFEMFENVSTSTSGTFLLTRARQGKEALACIVLPLLFFEIFCVIKNDCKISFSMFVLMVCTGISASLTSMFGNMLAPVMTAFLLLYILIKKKGLKSFILTGLTIVPNALAVLLYLIVD